MICNICDSPLILNKDQKLICNNYYNYDDEKIYHCIVNSNSHFSCYEIYHLKNDILYSIFSIHILDPYFEGSNLYKLYTYNKDIISFIEILKIKKYIPLQFKNDIIFPDLIFEKLKTYLIFS